MGELFHNTSSKDYPKYPEDLLVVVTCSNLNML